MKICGIWLNKLISNQRPSLSETQYWLELLKETRIGEPKEVDALLDEASQLLAIFTSAGKTAKRQKK